MYQVALVTVRFGQTRTLDNWEREYYQMLPAITILCIPNL